MPTDKTRRRQLGQWLAAPLSRLLPAVALPTALVSCAAPANRIDPPAGPINQVAPLTGERWRYALVNRYNDEPLGEVLAEVTRTTPDLQVRLTSQDGREFGTEIYTSAWNTIQEPLHGEQLRFDDPVPLLPDPLAVGIRHSMITQYRLPGSSVSRRWQPNLTAVGWERILVPGGQFDCLRVERTIYFEPYGMSRSAARRIETLWYAPPVKRWVMREWTGFYRDEITLDARRGFSSESREDSVRWALVQHTPAPVAR